jgi:hypothetical protein
MNKHVLRCWRVGSTARIAAAVGAVMLLALALPQPARANIYILESTAAGVRAGIELAPGDRLAIPAGAWVRAVLPSGKTQTIKGPYDGDVAGLGQGQPANEGILSWIREILKTGGATEATPGATRSIATPSATPPVRFSWSEIPIGADGNICVAKGAKLALVRAATGRAEKVIVVDGAQGRRAEAEWAAGSDVAPWPAEIAARTGGVYDLFIQDRARRRITLTELDRLPEESEVLRELHRLGCKQQFNAFVRSKLGASKGAS